MSTTATITSREEGTNWQKRYDATAPIVGELAPDFELSDASGNHSVRLSDYQAVKPVALIFGSFT